MKRRIETLLIGGGSVGVCSAYSLAKKGKPVTVVDQGQVGAGCSYGNAGIIALHHITPSGGSGSPDAGTQVDAKSRKSVLHKTST